MAHEDLAALLLVNTFALWAAFQLSIAATLSNLTPRWHGIVALFVPPLALYWAIKRGLRVRAVLWVLGLAIWLGVRIFFAR
jgi:hypothetical protein